MAKHEFDLFHGGSKQLLKYLEKQKKKLETVPERLVRDMTNILYSNVLSEAQRIQNNYQMYSAVYTGNVIERLGVAHMVIRNVTQEATYSEFGTGIEGRYSPYPKQELQWEYDVNNHGEAGWVYPIGEEFAWTKGQPANPTYFRASQRLRKRMPTLIKDEMKRVTD